MVRVGVVLNKSPGSRMYGKACKKAGLYRPQESQYIGAVSSTFQIVYYSKSCEIRFTTNRGQKHVYFVLFHIISRDVYCMEEKMNISR